MGWQDDPVVDPNAALVGDSDAQGLTKPGELHMQISRAPATLWAQDTVVPDEVTAAPPPAAAAPPGKPQSVADLRMGAGDRMQSALMRGMTLGVSDKIAALQDAANDTLFRRPGNFWDNYHASLDRERQDTDTFAEAHPIAARAAWGTGAVLAPIPRFTAAASLPGRMAQGAGVGAGVGATAGFGASDDKSLKGDLVSTALGAGVGGVLGGALPAAGEYVGQPLWNRFMQWYAGAPAVRGQAMREVGGALQSDIDAGGRTAGDMQQDLTDNFGKPVALVDAGGKNTRALLGSAARQPGPAQEHTEQFFRNRDNWAQARGEEDMNVGLNRGSAFQTGRQLLEQRSAQSRPLYDAALSETDASGLPRVISSPHLDRLLSTNEVVGPALAKGIHLEAIESAAENRPFNPNGLGVDLDQQGNIVYTQRPNMRTLNVIKKGLDASIAEERDAVTGRLSEKGVALDRFRRAYLGQLDQLNPDYAAARAAWAGPTQAFDAINFGKGIFNQTPEEIAEQLHGMSPANRDFVKLGAADAARARMAMTGKAGDESNVILGKGPHGQPVRQLEQLFDSPQEFTAWLRRPQLEQRMFQSGSDVLGNSATAARVAMDASRGGEHGGGGLPTMAVGMATGEAGLTAVGAARTAAGLRNWALRPTPQVNHEIARILANPSALENRASLVEAMRAAGAPRMLPRAIGPSAYVAGRTYPSLVSSLATPSGQQQ